MPNHAAVRIAGVVAGKVASQQQHGEQEISVRFCLVKGIALRQGTSAILRAASPLGERFVALIPGPASAPTLAAEAHLIGESPPRIEDLGELLWPIAQAFPPERLTQVMELLDKLPEDLGSAPSLEALNRLLTLAERILRTNSLPASHLLAETDRLQQALTILEKRFQQVDNQQVTRRLQRLQKMVTELRALVPADFAPFVRLADQTGRFVGGATTPGHGWRLAKSILQQEGLSGSLFARDPEQQQADLATYPLATSQP